MSAQTEHKIDRTGWPAGEWDNEPDRDHGVLDLVHNVYWLGFDCGHYQDMSPGLSQHLSVSYRSSPLRELEQYRNAAYVRAEVERLAEQLAARSS